MLIAGTNGTINGLRFGALPSDNQVFIGGVPSTVNTASATQLSVAIPSTVPCEATGAREVEVIVSGLSAWADLPLQVAKQRALAPGERILLSSPADVPCNELSQTGGRYIVAVYNNTVNNTSITAPPATAVELRGGQGIATSDPIPAVPTLANNPSSYGSVRRVSPMAVANLLGETQAARRADEKHFRLLEANTRILNEALPTLRKQYAEARFGTRASPGLSASPSAPGTVRRAVNPTLGANNVIRVPDINSGTFCNTFIEITARTVYAGTKAIILADNANPNVGDMNPTWTAVGQEMDNDMFAILQTNFGNPLAMDPATDNDGRIVMVFSNAVNTLGGVAGFVVSCDFLPRTHVYQGAAGTTPATSASSSTPSCPTT